MFEHLIFMVLTLAVPVILWVIPQTRTANGNWIIAWKTVSPGLLVLYETDWLLGKLLFLISEWKEENIALPSWVKLSIVLLAAFLFIAASTIFIRRKFGAGKKYNPVPSILLFLLLPPIIFIAASFISLAAPLRIQDYKGEWRSSWLPPEGNVKIAFQQQSIHPFLAEYNYRLRFTRDGKKFYQMLFCNPGGRTLFNLYRLKDGRLLFRDKDWDYLVDVSKQQVFWLKSAEGKLYAALIPNEEATSWSGPSRENGKIVMHMSGHAIPAEDVTGILDGMSYYGCIQYEFYPAAQKPEEQIKKKW